MPLLKGSRTEQNMRCALSGEIQSNQRYLTYAQSAEAEGYRDLAAQLRAKANEAVSHASGHLDYLRADDDPATNKADGNTLDRLLSAASTITEDHAAMCAGMARTAHDDGFDDIADWFETLAKAGRSHKRRLRHAVDASRHNGGGFD